MPVTTSGLANWRNLDHALGGDCLRISSYNIHRCVGRDRSLDVERVAHVIRELGCDTVGLQEVASVDVPGEMSKQLDFLAAETGMTAIAGDTIVRDGGSFGNALLTRRPVLAVRRHDLSYLKREPRGAIDVDLDIAGKVVRVIVTHLGLKPAERRFQVRQMLKVLHDIPPEQAVVVLGDINEWLPLGRPLRWMHGLLGHAPAERSFPSGLPLFALDRVWVRPRHTLLAFESHRSPASRVASDHLPVRAIVAPAAPEARSHVPHVPRWR
ncbi:MAG TPA: endonuclease/exonuclease/phosphatase family protein [Aromatoleum sp.]|uniref:endonuclease/exonuclease/phosphatase family protein n=1 Tax=Aromatoleum sp. TaxID=2307007 RepID=UPI002B49E865|nr:endonuclease/exonuclease/phosphatase family protein [Aromatoleum sp.]HJV24660.1 endonuclease/exonuclease/phosphatase family protein [Aromatoleum sp.]